MCFFWKFCKICQKSFHGEHLRATAFVIENIQINLGNISRSSRIVVFWKTFWNSRNFSEKNIWRKKFAVATESSNTFMKGLTLNYQQINWKNLVNDCFPLQQSLDIFAETLTDHYVQHVLSIYIIISSMVIKPPLESGQTLFG